MIMIGEIVGIDIESTCHVQVTLAKMNSLNEVFMIAFPSFGLYHLGESNKRVTLYVNLSKL